MYLLSPSILCPSLGGRCVREVQESQKQRGVFSTSYVRLGKEMTSQDAFTTTGGCYLAKQRKHLSWHS